MSKRAQRARRVAAILRVAGLETQIVEEPTELPKPRADSAERVLVLSEAEELDAVIDQCRDDASTQVLAMMATPDATLFGMAARLRQLAGVMGLGFGPGMPRPWELLQVVNRFAIAEMPASSTVLDWGHYWFEREVCGRMDRDELLEHVRRLCSEFRTPSETSDVCRLADELIMNALYDAPVDACGRERYAHQRQAEVNLQAGERPTFGVGCDGSRIVISVADPFGRLQKETVFEGIHRGLTTGKPDLRGGGAGLGMLLIHRAATVLTFDVVRGRRTQVTAIVDLSLSATEALGTCRSVHFFNYD